MPSGKSEVLEEVKKYLQVWEIAQPHRVVRNNLSLQPLAFADVGMRVGFDTIEQDKRKNIYETLCELFVDV